MVLLNTDVFIVSSITNIIPLVLTVSHDVLTVPVGDRSMDVPTVSLMDKFVLDGGSNKETLLKQMDV